MKRFSPKIMVAVLALAFVLIWCFSIVSAYAAAQETDPALIEAARDMADFYNVTGSLL